MSATEKQIRDAIAQMQRAGKLPRGLSAAQVDKLAAAIERSIGDVADQSLVGKIRDAAANQIQHIASATEPAVRRSLLADLGNLLTAEGASAAVYRTLDRTQTLFNGAGTFLSQNLSPEAVNNFPALALERMFSRDVPRGDKKVKGVVEADVDPDDAWPARWQEAGENCGEDDSWLPWEGDAQTGRGVALKSSAIWEALGNLRDDSIGNPFAPFAWESGFRTTSVPRAECVRLGLLDENETAEPARFKLEDLFPSPA